MLDQHKIKRDLEGVENLSADILCLKEDSCVNKTSRGQKGWFNHLIFSCDYSARLH
jgi:hypothetical protein